MKDDDAAVQVVSLYQAQRKIYTRGVEGRFAAWRWVFVWATQLVFYGLPWLLWNGRQAVLFDLGARRFYVFGLVLYPQDFIYLTGLLVLCAYALFLFTAVAGRLWCGFACPQTVYTEIFMWVEQRFEGERSARMRLDAAPWTLNKLWRKGGKHLVWVVIALWTGLSFVGYFTPIRTLLAEASVLVVSNGSPAAQGLGPWEWFWVLFYAFATWGNAGFMREQVCKYMCPYARFQGAMFDRDTMIVTYDGARGEPRGSRGRSVPHAQLATLGKGDCIDCTLCVQVCPTGIDIRQGQQIECIGCAACIDACDDVMIKMAYPKGLIRFATQNGIDQRWTPRQMLARVARPRVLIYGTVMALIASAFLASLVLRPAFRVDVVRDRGALARQAADGAIENSYRLQIMNNVEAPQHYRVRVESLAGARLAGGADVLLGPVASRWVAVSVQLDAGAAQALGSGAHPMRFVVERQGESAGYVSEKSTFLVPR